jgi:serine/threonine protein kinase
MATPSQSDQLSDQECADLLERVARFRDAWKPDGSGGLGRYLPQPGARHRSTVLVQILITDMELRARAGLPFNVETYTKRFPADLVAAMPPVALLAAEYQFRHQFTDKPDLTEYRDRFPASYDDFTIYLEQLRSQATKPAMGMGSVRVPPPTARTGGAKSGTVFDSRRTPAKHAPSGAPKFIGELMATNMGQQDTDPDQSAPAPAPVTRSISSGSILPTDAPYQLVRQIGSGAFGEVFEAFAPGGIRVAVKRIMRTVDHPSSLAEREALDAIKQLSHPYLLKTNAYWVFDNQLIIVMEMADGSLAGRAEYYQGQGRVGVPTSELIPLFEEAGEALDYLHEQNIAHRDIKPENILLMKGHAKVADFGLARPQENQMSTVGNTVGTPAYMAPEMWQQKISLQSDQYSLAATYVRVRLGKPLFDTTVLIEMASFHVHEMPDLNPLPAAEQAVLLRALAKNPDDRFPTCLEFARALRAAVTGTGSHQPLPLGTGSFAPLPTGGSRTHASVGGSGQRRPLPSGTQPNLPRVGTGTHPMLPPEEYEPAPRRRFEAVIRTAAIAVACALAVVAGLWVAKPYLFPTSTDKTADKNGDKGDKGGDNKQAPVVPEKKFASYPAKWDAVEDAGTHAVRGTHYHQKLTRKVAGEELVAVLVYPTGPGDPEPFYILQNKITNRVFAETWREVMRGRQATLAEQLQKDFSVFGTWRKGAETLDGDFLGIEGDQAGVPVLGVTLPEALLVARELGGTLPSILEWKKAAGALNEDDNRPGPAGPPLPPLPQPLRAQDKREEAAEWKREALAKRNLALGQKFGPLPVAKQTNDMSHPWKVHQLVSNGPEWLGVDINGQPLNLANIPDWYIDAPVFGLGPNELVVATFDMVRKPGTQSWKSTTPQTGFRVVLKPQ